MTTSMFLTPDKQSYIPIIYTTKDGKEITLTMDDIKRFLVRGNPEAVTIQELVFFAGVCRARGMDPYAGDCYLIKYGKKDSAAIVTARSYFESRAKAQKDCDGWKAGIIVITEDGEGEEVKRVGALLRPGDLLIGGWFEGTSSKWKFPLEIEVSLQMYIKKTSEGHITKFWAPEKQPHMIRKIALVQGLRELWPGEFANLYASEEMGPETIEPEAITLQPSDVTDVETAKDPIADLKADLEKKKEEDAKKAEEEAVTAKEKEEAEAKKKQELTAYRAALVKTFDVRTDLAKLSSQEVNDYLFLAIEKVGEGATLDDIKVQAMEQGLIDSAIKEMLAKREGGPPPPPEKEEETEVVVPPALVTVATLGTDTEEIIKHFKMRKKEGILDDLKMYEAEKHLWPLDAQVAYAQKIKDMTRGYPTIMAKAMAEIYPLEPTEEAAAPSGESEVSSPCGKCGEETTAGDLCAKCGADEAGEGGEDDKTAFYQFLEKMGEFKKQLIEVFGKDTGEGKYYAVLGSHGFEKSNEITDRAIQIDVYREVGDLLKP